jgi:hypothetical protein
MIKKDFSAVVCRPYCVFFKEGQKEDMACGAAPAAMELILRGLVSVGDLPAPPSGGDLRRDNLRLREAICSTCPFVVDGCDFRLPQPPEDSVPCGGFVLLALLWDSGMIGPDELRTTVDE